MDFSFTEEQENFRQEIIDFCEKEMLGEPNSPAGSSSLVDRAVEKGWAGLSIPKEYGGQGRDAVCQVIFNEEISYRQTPLPLLWWGNSFSELGRICLKHGSEEQKKKWLPRLARGTLIGQCFTEPEAGTDMTRIQTKAVRQGDHYIVNGQKAYGSGTDVCKYALLMARTDADAPPERGISLFVMDYDSSGVNITPLMTMGGIMTSMVFLDDVKIPRENLIGEENRGFDYYLEDRPFYLNKSPGAEVGTLQRTFENLIQYAKETKREGRLLSQEPVVRQKLAQMATDFKAMRLLAYRMAWMETQGLDISLIANVVRVLTVEAWLKFDSVAMQLLGLGGQLTPDSKYAPLGGIMEGMYRFDALQWFNRTGPSYTKSFIATHGLGMPEF